jgi:hypothetical protein
MKISFLSFSSLFIIIYIFYFILDTFHDDPNLSLLLNLRLYHWTEKISLIPTKISKNETDPEDNQDKPPKKHNNTHDDLHPDFPEFQTHEKHHNHPNPVPIYSGKIKIVKCSNDCILLQRASQLLKFKRLSRDEIYGTNAYLEFGGITPLKKNASTLLLCKLNKPSHF